MQCSWCNRRGMCQSDHPREWGVQGLWSIGGIGLLCNSCDDHGDPPHARYLQGLFGKDVSRTSSALIAAHLGCMDLRNGITNMGLAGGVHLLLAPDLYINFAKAHMLSPNGRCATFDETADGFCRAEGSCMVVLKRVSEAEADENVDDLFVATVLTTDEGDGTTSGAEKNRQAEMAAELRVMGQTDASVLDTGGLDDALLADLEGATKQDKAANKAAAAGSKGGAAGGGLLGLASTEGVGVDADERNADARRRGRLLPPQGAAHVSGGGARCVGDGARAPLPRSAARGRRRS